MTLSNRFDLNASEALHDVNVAGLAEAVAARTHNAALALAPLQQKTISALTNYKKSTPHAPGVDNTL